MSSTIDQSLWFKIRKVLRYIDLYGPERTWVKIKGDYHLRRTKRFTGATWQNPACRSPQHTDRFVALVGCGGFAYSNLAFYLKKLTPYFLRATYDVLPERAYSLCADYGGAYVASDFDQILADPAIRLIYIASNHASHAEYAVQALDAGKHVHIEKPHVINEQQLSRLNKAQERNPRSMVFLGFNRPRSGLFRRAMQTLAAQEGPLMVNWFIAGHRIPDDHWYFSEAEGGRILGNLCHWTDLTLEMVGHGNAFPCQVSAVSAPGARSDFAISIQFADNSVAAITFSAKGHTFEGVREVLNAHRGDALLALNDFQKLRTDVGANRRNYRKFFRDHGHQANIENSYAAARMNDYSRAVSLTYSNATARLFLAVKKAVDTGTSVVVKAEDCLGES
jgi:predicted dehydrogenase